MFCIALKYFQAELQHLQKMQQQAAVQVAQGPLRSVNLEVLCVNVFSARTRLQCFSTLSTAHAFFKCVSFFVEMAACTLMVSRFFANFCITLVSTFSSLVRFKTTKSNPCHLVVIIQINVNGKSKPIKTASLVHYIFKTNFKIQGKR